MDGDGGPLWQVAAVFALGGLLRGWERQFEPGDRIGARVADCLIVAGLAIAAAVLAESPRGFALLLCVPLGACTAAELVSGAAGALWLRWRPDSKGPPRR